MFPLLEGRGWIIFFDIDDFKFVNDSFGHNYGDFALMSIAQLIREAYGTIGCGYRIGGDEFCVLSTCADEREIQAANDRFLANLRQARNEDIKIPWVSLGHALYDGTKELNESVEAADRELFSYKRAQKQSEVLV